MFANMGPSPTGRSGHALTTYQNKVIVLGGESFTGSKPDDPAVVHVLDTGKIKYPPDNANRTGSGAGTPSSSMRKPSGGLAGAGSASSPPASQQGHGPSSIAQRSMSPVPLGERAASPTASSRPPLNGIVGMMNQSPELQQQQQQGSQILAQQQQQQQPPISTVLQQSQTIQQQVPPQQLQQLQQQQQAQQMMQQQQQQQPQQLAQRAMSPTGLPRTQALQPSMIGAAGGAAGGVVAANALQQRAMSPPTTSGPGSTYTGPRSQRSLENLRGGGATSPNLRSAPNKLTNGFSDSTPADGFYQQATTTNGAGNSAAAAAELENARKREAWLKAALALAVKKGFVPPEQLPSADSEALNAPDDLKLEDLDTGADGTDKDRIVRALITLKTKLAAAQVSRKCAA